MQPTRADLDGIRALGELARRQADHISAVTEYMHTHCRADGAFGGVLNLFQGAYSQAFGFAETGLGTSLSGAQKVSESMAASAAAYEHADRGSYDALARLGKDQGWNIDAFKAPGSGNSSVLTGGGVPQDMAGKIGVAPPAGPEGRQWSDYATTAQSFAESHGKPFLDGMANADKTLLVRDEDGNVTRVYRDEHERRLAENPGLRYRELSPQEAAYHELPPDKQQEYDDLAKSNDPGAAAARQRMLEGSRFDRATGGIEQGLKYTDPGAMLRERAVQMGTDAIGQDASEGARARVGDADAFHDAQSRAKAGLDTYGKATDTVGAAQAVHGAVTSGDYTLGVGDSLGEAKDALENRSHYQDLARQGVSAGTAENRAWSNS